MKKTAIILSLIFAVAIALSVSIPTMAAVDTESTTITGTIGPSIEITAHPGDFSLSDMVIGTPKESSALTVSVRCNKAHWTLVAAEVSGDGCMANASTALANPLQVKGGDVGSYVSLATAPSLESDGAKTTGVDIANIYFAQNASWIDDAALIYTIDVTFTATIN